MTHKTGTYQLHGKTYKIVTLDFETYYDKVYTLSGQLNMSEYIRDARFHAHGVGIKVGNGKPKWYTGPKIVKAIRKIDWSKCALLAHNVAFDGFICSQRYGVVPALYLDTLSMARGAHGHHMRHDLDTLAKAHGLAGKTKRAALADTKGKLELTKSESAALGSYCLEDVENTYEVFWKMVDYIPDDEMRLIDLTQRMFCDPVLLIDTKRVETELANEVGGKIAALLESGATAESLMSNVQFAQLLRDAGADIPMKISPSTGELTFAFAKSDLDFQALLEHSNPRVAALARARVKIKSTIGETRANRFLEAGRDGMKLPVLLNYSGAHTHRWSGGNKMNLQNLKRGGELRKSILAPPGHVIVVADSAQIEARVLAWLAGQHDIVQAFATKSDVYKLMASAIFGIPIEQVTKDQRFLGKVCVLGLGYGMGPAKLQLTLKQGVMGPAVDLTLEECRRIVNIYRSRNYRIRGFWSAMDSVIAAMVAGAEGRLGPIEYGKNFIRLPNGMFLQYYGLQGEIDESGDQVVVRDAVYLTRTGKSKIYGGLLTENVVQALARCIIAEQILAVTDAGWRVVTTTHDEIVAIAPEHQAEACMADMLRIMATPPKWAAGLPLAAEGGYDINYSK